MSRMPVLRIYYLTAQLPDRTIIPLLVWQRIEGSVYAESMGLFSLIIHLAAELAKLARMLFTDGIRFMALLARSRTALSAENLFLRKQLAFYQERRIRPQRFDNVTRFMLVPLSHVFAWQDALVNVTPKIFIGWHRAGFRLFWR